MRFGEQKQFEWGWCFDSIPKFQSRTTSSIFTPTTFAGQSRELRRQSYDITHIDTHIQYKYFQNHLFPFLKLRFVQILFVFGRVSKGQSTSKLDIHDLHSKRCPSHVQIFLVGTFLPTIMHAESAFPTTICTGHKDELCMMFRKKVPTKQNADTSSLFHVKSWIIWPNSQGIFHTFSNLLSIIFIKN